MWGIAYTLSPSSPLASRAPYPRLLGIASPCWSLGSRRSDVGSERRDDAPTDCDAACSEGSWAGLEGCSYAVLRLGCEGAWGSMLSRSDLRIFFVQAVKRDLYDIFKGPVERYGRIGCWFGQDRLFSRGLLVT